MDLPKIVCIDDEPAVLYSLRGQLSRYFDDDYDIELFETGADAFRLLKEWSAKKIEIPLVISDYIMPGVNGAEFLKEVHNIIPQTLKVLLTGQASADAVGEIINHAKLFRYISKPWEEGDLKLTVESAIKSYYQDRELENKNEELRQVNEQLEEKVNERTQDLNLALENIHASINYASKIQQALLGSKENILSKLEDGFILFQPKDVVSGDFYWFSEIENNQIYVVSDCTGHGVPGAFMTVLGINLLDEIVNLQRIIDPTQILHELDKKVLEATKNTDERLDVNDGMDIGVLVYNPSEKSILYSGAKMPIFQITEGEPILYKGSVFSIGGEVSSSEKTYKTISISFKKGDKFYLYSDGFQDQFGGEKSKKFMSKKFRALLHNLSHLPMQKQNQELRSMFFDWKGNNPQTDDILVMGMEI